MSSILPESIGLDISIIFVASSILVKYFFSVLYHKNHAHVVVSCIS